MFCHHDAANNGKISVINPDGVKQADISIGVFSRTEGVVLLDRGVNSKLYVVGRDANSNSVHVIPLSDPSAMTTLLLDEEPAGIVITRDGNRVYVAETVSSKIRVIDTVNDAFLPDIISNCAAPAGIAITLDGGRILVPCSGSGEFFSIDLESGTSNNILVGYEPSIYGNPVAGAILPEHITALHPTAYITNSDDDNISVIDTEKQEVVATIPVGEHPEGIAISPDSHRAYVTNNEGNSLSVINTVTNEVIKTIPVGEEPLGVCVHPDGSKIYIANMGNNSGLSNSGSISVIDAATLTEVQTISNVYNPYGICTDGAGSNLYVTNYYSGTVSVYDAISGTPHPNYPTITVGNEPCGIVMRDDGKFLYVANHGANTLSVIDFEQAPTSPVVTNIPVGIAPIDVTINPAGDKLFVSCPGSNQLSEIDITTNSLVASMHNVGSGARGIAFSPHSSKIIVVKSNNNWIVIRREGFSTSPWAVVEVGSNPESFGEFVTHEEVRAYVPTKDSDVYDNGYGVVAVLDTEREAVENFIHVSVDDPIIQLHPDGHQLVIGPSGPAGSDLQIVSTLTNSEIGMYSLSANPNDLAYSPDGSKIYVAGMSSTNEVIDTETGVASALALNGLIEMNDIEISPDGEKLYGIESNPTAQLVSIDLTIANPSPEIISTPALKAIVFHPTEEKAYVSTTGAEILTINTQTNSVVAGAEIAGLGTINAFTINPDGNMLYYIKASNRRLYSIDLTAGNVVTEIGRVGINSKCLQLAPDGKKIYVLDEGTENFIIVDLETSTIRMENIKGKATGCGCFVRYPK